MENLDLVKIIEINEILKEEKVTVKDVKNILKNSNRLNNLLYDSFKYFIEEEAIDKPLIENIKINNVTKQLIYTYLRKNKVEIVDLSEIEKIVCLITSRRLN